MLIIQVLTLTWKLCFKSNLLLSLEETPSLSTEGSTPTLRMPQSRQSREARAWKIMSPSATGLFRAKEVHFFAIFATCSM